MIKNATFYTIFSVPPVDFDVMSALEPARFEPCGPTQPVSTGFVPPRGEGEPLCECLNNQMIFKIMTETKTVPAEIMERCLAAACHVREQQTGRKPGKKEKREIKEELLLDLLPKAFPKRIATTCWIDPVHQRLVIDTASRKRADEVASLLVQTMKDLVLMAPVPNTNPSIAMAAWLLGTVVPQTLAIDTGCVLKGNDEAKTKVKYEAHNLDIPEIKDHIKGGLAVESLDVTYLNRVSFVMTKDLTLKKINILDDILDNQEEKPDAFDADMFISFTEVNAAIDDLIQELDGEGADTKNQV